jgi:Uma2 family endonuclease
MTIRGVTAPTTEQTRLEMSYDEFLLWAGEETRAEWVDGAVIIHMPPKPIHQITLGFLYNLLQMYVDLLALGKVYIAPFEVLIRPGRSSREPDIFFVSRENHERLTPDRMVGPPDLIVEIVSTDSVQRDRYEKFVEYRDAGVREYWIVDPRPGKRRADFYHLDEAGEYELFATEDDEQVISRVLPGFWLCPAWLWQAEALEPLALFLEMRGIPGDQIAALRQRLRGGSSEAEQ